MRVPADQVAAHNQPADFQFSQGSLGQFAFQIFQAQILQLDGCAGDGMHLFPFVLPLRGKSQHSEHGNPDQVLQGLAPGQGNVVRRRGSILRAAFFRARQPRQNRSIPHNAPAGTNRKTTRTISSTRVLFTTM